MINKIIGLFFTIVGITFFISSLKLSIGTLKSLGPGAFPLLISVLLIICGIVTIFYDRQSTDRN